MKSPKIVIDEYLLAEEVQDVRRPCYFLVDMGEWHVNNSVITVNVELEPRSDVYERHEKKLTDKKDIMYESWDMTITDIKILYNYHSYMNLLVQTGNLNFRAIDKFTFGLQF